MSSKRKNSKGTIEGRLNAALQDLVKLEVEDNSKADTPTKDSVTEIVGIPDTMNNVNSTSSVTDPSDFAVSFNPTNSVINKSNTIVGIINTNSIANVLYVICSYEIGYLEYLSLLVFMIWARALYYL